MERLDNFERGVLNAVITHRWAHSAIEKIAPGSTTLVDLHRNVVSGPGNNLYHFMIVLLHSHFNLQTPRSRLITEVRLHDMATLPHTSSRVRSRDLDHVAILANEICQKAALALIVMDLTALRSARSQLTCAVL
jgi:hypothetical protein